MAPLNNTRLAWGVALASLALWATTAPLAWGQVSAGARGVSETLTSSSSSSSSDDTGVADDASAQSVPCVAPLPTQVAIPAVPNVAPAPADSADTGTFRLCGPDPSVAQAIEQLIAGRSFSASLSARGDGCADLTIRVTSQTVGGSASSRLIVSLGSGQNLDLNITSGGGATHVSIGANQ
jgi:hypothetical protein